MFGALRISSDHVRSQVNWNHETRTTFGEAKRFLKEQGAFMVNTDTFVMVPHRDEDAGGAWGCVFTHTGDSRWHRGELSPVTRSRTSTSNSGKHQRSETCGATAKAMAGRVKARVSGDWGSGQRMGRSGRSFRAAAPQAKPESWGGRCGSLAPAQVGEDVEAPGEEGSFLLSQARLRLRLG